MTVDRQSPSSEDEPFYVPAIGDRVAIACYWGTEPQQPGHYLLQLTALPPLEKLGGFVAPWRTAEEVAALDALMEAVEKLHRTPIYHDCKGPHCALCSLGIPIEAVRDAKRDD